MKHLLLIGMLFTFLSAGCQADNSNTTFHQVEMLENPQGVSTVQPRLSWQITADVPNALQDSYRVQVAANAEDLKKEKNLLWDSGVIKSDQSHLIPYDGEQLLSRGKYYWRVKVSINGNEKEWSDINHWSMALLNDSDWQAQWIGEDAMSNQNESAEGDTRLAARYNRKPFEAKRKIKRSMIYISGLGTYEA